MEVKRKWMKEHKYRALQFQSEQSSIQIVEVGMK
jgi:hypothetical protein